MADFVKENKANWKRKAICAKEPGIQTKRHQDYNKYNAYSQSSRKYYFANAGNSYRYFGWKSL